MRATTRSDNNIMKFSKYILCYVNNILVVHHNAMSILNQLIEYLPLKPSSVGNPNKYLGSKLKKTRLDNKLEAWEMSPSKYVTWAAKNCASHLTKKIARKYPVPECTYNLFSTDYCATTNITEPLTPEYASFFMHLIGVLRWMVKLGQIDIVTEVSMLLLYLAYPKKDIWRPLYISWGM